MKVAWEFSPELLREAREARGLSRLALAGRMGVRMEAVRNWEMRKNKVQMDNLLALATALDCEPGSLFVRRET